MLRLTAFLLAFLVSLSACVEGQAQVYQIGHASRVFVDSSRNNRAIPVEIYYPATWAGDEVPPAPGIFPVISLGHGFVMTINAYANVWQALVPAGYILVLPDTETGTSPSHAALGLDLAFVLQHMKAEGVNPASLFHGHVANTSAVMGHSMGGGASFLAAAVSPEITAIANFAAAITNPSSVTAATQITQPALLFAGSEDCVTPPSQHQLPMYDSLASACKTYVSISGGGHCYFANYNLFCSVGENLCFPNLTISREEQQAFTFMLLIPWLDCWLKDMSGACASFQDTLVSSTAITYQQSCSGLGVWQHGSTSHPCEVFPIPFRDQAEIACESEILSLEVYDLFGTRLIQQYPGLGLGNIRIDTTGLPSGIYLIRIRDKHGKQQVIRGIKIL